MQAKAKSLIQQYYDSFNQQDMSTFLGLLDNQIIHEVNQGEKQIGLQPFTRFMDEMNEFYQETVKDLIIMANEEGTRASAEFIIEGVYKKTQATLPVAHNQRYALRCGAFFEIKNNKITRVTNYYNLQEWLKQIGI